MFGITPFEKYEIAFLGLILLILGFAVFAWAVGAKIQANFLFV